MNLHGTDSKFVPRAASDRRTLVRALVARFLLVVAMSATSLGWAQETAWELRACADPFALPFSGREQPGFENAIAEILADELGAELTYDWIAFSPDMVNLHLREGTCDVMLGVPDGHMDLATTIAYYRSPYVFVTRSDAPFEIDSLDDPVLADLRIGVQNPGVPPHDALLARGYAGNIVGPRSATPNPVDRVLREVAAGDVDVGVIWGPVAGYYAARSEADLRIEPITPQFDPPFLSMSFSMTMGVRPGDDQLRDLLNRAIAARWDEIQSTLVEYGVPLVEGAPPVGSLEAATERDATVLAVLGPIKTGQRTNAASLYDLAGDAARNGAELGERVAPDLFPESDLAFLYATTPSAVAATRAAERLVATEGADVLIGGLGAGQAAAIGRVAADHDVLFLNSGSPDLTLRRMCLPTTLHVEASAAAYLDVLVRHHADAGLRSWAIVHEATEEGSARAEAARRSVERHGDDGTVVDVEGVEPSAANYGPVLASLRESGADAVLLILDSADQIAFEGQMNSWGIDATVVALADPVQQTRDYMTAAMERTFRTENAVRAVAWEHGRDEGGELSERYAAQFGEPMESSAYAYYQAVLAAAQAVEAVGGEAEAEAYMTYLTDGDTRVAGPKGSGVSFRAEDHQLRQPIDLIEVRTDAEWRNTVEAKIGMARFLTTVPNMADGSDAAVDRLDALSGALTGACDAP